MVRTIFSDIDWSRPWLCHLAATAKSIISERDWCAALNREAAKRNVHNHRGLPLCFVPQDCLPPDMAYETFISNTGQVPTRDNLHDFFNGLVWLVFPSVKARLNAIQAAEITRAAVESCDASAKSSVRGRVRDAATIFDENAVLLITPNTELVLALREHRWKDAFCDQRLAFDDHCEVILFGHALMEKLVAPYKSVTGHARWVVSDPAYFSKSPADRICWVDAVLAGELQSSLSITEFTPLPILGVPGWWDGQTSAFYDDASVFRPPKSRR